MSRMITVVHKENNFFAHEMEFRSRDSVDAHITKYGIYTIGGRNSPKYGKTSYQGRVLNDHLYLFQLQKFRRKVETVTNKQGDPIRVNGKQKRDPIRKSHWKLKVFKFPLDRVIEAKQGLRTFKIKLFA